MKKKLLILLSAFALSVPGIVSCKENEPNIDGNDPDSGETTPGGNENIPGGDVKPDVNNLKKYGIKFNIPKAAGNDYSIKNEEIMSQLTETEPLIKTIDVKSCYKDGGFKFSSKSNGGILTITLKEAIEIENINLVCKQYHDESPEVNVDVGTYSGTINGVKNGDNVLTFPKLKTDTIRISSAPKKRFILDEILLNGSTNGNDNGGNEGGDNVEPSKKEPATVKVSVVGNGKATSSVTEGMSGDKCTIVVTPDENHYVTKVIANGERPTRNRNTFTFTLKPGTNLVNVEFKEYVPGEGHDELFESPEAMNYGTRGSQGSVDDYYESCRGLSGEALKNELYTIIQPTKRYSYDHLKESFPVTDENPDNPGYMTLMYTGEQYSIRSFSGWTYINREHTWPNSRGSGKTGPGSDKHMQRPCEQKINSTRGSLDFGDAHNGKDLGAENSKNAGCYKSSSRFEPKDDFKGDTARIIFYMATCYSNFALDKPSDSRYNFFPKSNQHGDFDDLYQWATDPSIDPVSKFEMSRNNQVDIEYQHNRNPFIDHPEFIEMIYDKNYSGPGALLD